MYPILNVVVGVLTVRKLHLKLEQPSLPYCLVFPRYRTVPLLQVEGSLRCLHRSRNEAEGVVFAPGFAVRVLVSSVAGVPEKIGGFAYRSSCSRACVSDILCPLAAVDVCCEMFPVRSAVK